MLLYRLYMTVGVLALQGDFSEHIDVLRTLKAKATEVRNAEDLSRSDALIIPGGESTAISKMLISTGLMEPIRERVRRENFPIYGTCAGAILLAKHVTGKHVPKTLELMDIAVDRNAYGTQLQSFEGMLRIKGIAAPLPVAFIRAPKITNVSKQVEVLSSHKGMPMLVRQGNLLAGSFHPEVRGSTEIHRIFLELCKS